MTRPRGAQLTGAALSVAQLAGCLGPSSLRSTASRSATPDGDPSAGALAGEAPAEPPAPLEPPPPASPELTYDPVQSARIAQLTPRLLGLAMAFSNEAPRPVTRGYAQVLHVQFLSDRRSPGRPLLVEAPAAALHGPTLAAEKVEPCAAAPSPGVELSTRAGQVLVRRSPERDQVLVGEPGKLRPVKLPPGSLHGACLDPDRRRLWLGWSTPERPAELFSISVREGSFKALRMDGRPGLGPLDDVRVSAGTLESGGPFLALEPQGAPRAVVILPVPADAGPLARWDPLARALADANITAVRTAPADVQRALMLARARWNKPALVLQRGAEPPAPAEDARLLWLIGPAAPASALMPPPPGTLVVGDGEPTRPSLTDLAARRPGGALSWTVATGPSPERAAALAWARLIDAALTPPAAGSEGPDAAPR